ncbi:DUF924 family protein [Novispirillum sp. DQ9]|uniref:DUF924 family protein n=1 Tax=Novispirillum sp. DQ9 TaxID=3398612 RepID=UPI003C7A0534
MDRVTDRVRTFWFGDRPDTEHPWWFERSDALDATIAREFTADVEAAAKGLHDGLQDSPEGCVVLCILLDQFPRHIWRGTARAFATDARALAVSRHAVARGFDGALAPVEKLFLYLPLEHAEDIAAQEQCVALFQATGHARWVDYAQRHRAIIARFGRFPHRNAALGRATTEEEAEFLTQPGSSF